MKVIGPPASGESLAQQNKKRHRADPAATALRIIAGVLTAAAIIGGAGWLLSQTKKRRQPSPPSGP